LLALFTSVRVGELNQGAKNMEAKGFVVPPGGGAVWDMEPGRSAALKLLGGMVLENSDGLLSGQITQRRRLAFLAVLGAPLVTRLVGLGHFALNAALPFHGLFDAGHGLPLTMA
jgi:hypothetical protein